MNLKQLALTGTFLGLTLGLAADTFAQAAGGRTEFDIKNITQKQTDAPNYGGSSNLGGHPSTLWRKWLMIEVQFESTADWADDVQVKYYVLIGKGQDRRMFVGEVTHINVAKGTQHYSAMFMQPNTLRRYGAGEIEQVTVRIFHKGALVSTKNEPTAVKDGWWDRFQPTPGYLLAPQDTPWAPIADERFEAVKPMTRQQDEEAATMLASDRILALDIGAASVKMGEFQASKTHGLRLTNFNYAELGIDPEHEENRKALIVTTIRNALREKKFKATRVVFSVSGQSVFTRFVKLPPVDDSKVVQIIQYEAQQNVPFPIDEVIWDYQLLGNTEAGELEVVLLAIKSDIIDDLNEGVESAGLRTEIIDVAPMALSNAVRYNEGETEGCTMLVDIGARTTNLLFLEKNRLFSRSIPIAGNAITQSIASEFNVPFLDAEAMKKAKGFVALGGAYEEPEDEQQARISKIIRNVMTRLHAEIARSINFYKGQQGGGAPQRLLLSGGSSIIPYTDRFFQEKLQLPVQLFSPFRNVELGDDIPREDLAKCAHFFGEVVGLGLRRVTQCPVEVNLTPKSIKARKQIQQKRPYFFGAAAALLLIPLCLLAYTKKTTELRERELTEVKAEVEKLSNLDGQRKRKESDLAEIKASADQIAGVVQQRSYWMDLLDDFNQRCDSNMWITVLTPEACGGASGAGNTGAAMRNPSGRGRQAEMEPSPQPASSPSPSGSTGCTELRIDGGGRHSTNDLDVVDQFARNLRSSPFFDNTALDQGVVIESLPSMARETTFSFSIRAKLRKPVTLPTN